MEISVKNRTPGRAVVLELKVKIGNLGQKSYSFRYKLSTDKLTHVHYTSVV